MSGQVNVTVEDSIGTIWLDHPERRNAISSEMWVGLTAAAAQVDGDPQVRVIVLRGAGTEAFASGADISQFGERRSGSDANAGYDRTTGAAYQSLAGASKPVLALIHGFCIGGGLAVALSADLRLAADDATFAIPAARLGLGYGAGGIQNLMQLVGPSATRRILFTAQRFDAVEALRIGLVDEVVPKAELDGRVEELAATIAANAPLTVRAAKLAVRELQASPERRDLDAVAAAVQSCFDSQDYQEGVRAFMEKRRPEFKGA